MLKIGAAWLLFVEPGVKVNGNHYRDVFLSQRMLFAIRHIMGDNFGFQQDSAPAHQTCDTIKLLQREKPDFIPPELWSPNRPD